MKSAIRVALYARVSTDDRGQDPQNQLLVLRKFARAQGWTIVAEYVDRATGKNGDRARFDAMWKDAEAHRFDCLLFWSLDRLTREGTLPTLQYLKRLTTNGIKFKSYTEAYIDSLGPFGDAIIGLIAALAAHERRLISERTKAGLERARIRLARQGRTLGRPRKSIDLARARAMRAEGETWRAIGEKFGVSPAFVWLRLKKRRKHEKRKQTAVR
jgi:DNA invertase Pin-like site-specific DNA recombinase